MRYLLLLALGGSAVFAQDGAAIFKDRCAMCHDMPQGRVPPTSALRAMSPLLILRALESGAMKIQAEGLTSNERVALMAYLLTPAPPKAPLPATAFCTGNATTTQDPSKGPRWTGWSTDVTNMRFQTTAGLSAADVPKLKLKWAFSLGDGIVARSQPAIAGGRIFVGNQIGAVYSLDARTGCIHWTFEGDAAVRSAIIVGAAAAYFGDGKANVYALDLATGKLLWKVRVENHFMGSVTGAPQLYNGTLYVPVSSGEEAVAPIPTYECCTFRGSVVALDAATGKQIWKTNTIPDAVQPTKKSKMGTQLYGPSGAGVWSTPTIDEKRDAVYVATGDNYSDPPTKTSDAVLALDRKTGKLLWSRQLTANDAFNNGCPSPLKINCPESEGPDHDFGQPPILVSLANGKRALVIGQKSGMAHALDPDQQGEILWQTRVGQGSALGGSQWGSAADRDNMYVAVSDLKIKGIVADKTNPQGFSLALDPDQGGGLFALRLTTGEKVWSSKTFPCGERKNCSPAQSAAVTVIPGVAFSGSVDGHLRGYSTSTGEVVWDVDTVRDYETVNGAKARGGSLDGPGPTIAGGMLYVNSGYGQFGGAPGNALLAFSVDGR